MIRDEGSYAPESLPSSSTSHTYHPVCAASSAESLGFCTHPTGPSCYTPSSFVLLAVPHLPALSFFLSLVSLIFALLLSAHGARYFKTQNWSIHAQIRDERRRISPFPQRHPFLLALTSLLSALLLLEFTALSVIPKG